MTTISLHGNPIETAGELPAVGSTAPEFTLISTELAPVKLSDYSGKTVILNIFPSIDTPICSLSVQRFNADAGSRDNTVVLCISGDLPFAHSRFCGAEGIENVIPLSTFQTTDFGKDYGVAIVTGPLTGLMSRAVVIIGEDGKIVYTEQVPEIAQEPDYEAALAVL